MRLTAQGNGDNFRLKLNCWGSATQLSAREPCFRGSVDDISYRFPVISSIGVSAYSDKTIV